MSELTPLMKQYGELKAQVPDALLFFRMGDFYELFGPDAVDAAQILEITLTSRDKNKPNALPMCGVPHHSAQSYIQKLLQAGKKVAIGEQMEDPSAVKGKGIVKRDIIRILSPGIQFDLEGSETFFLGCLARAPDKTYVLALVDASTGETLLSEAFAETELAAKLSLRPLRHLLTFAPLPFSMDGLLVEELPENYLTADLAKRLLEKQFEVAQIEPLVPHKSGVLALGIAVQYLLRSQKVESLPHLRTPRALSGSGSLSLSAQAIDHLDLLPKNRVGISLFEAIQMTKSALGSRELKRWLLAPLNDLPRIQLRQSAVRELADQPLSKLESMQKAFSEAYDLERILGRVHTQLANPRDTLALGQTLACFSALLPHQSHLQSSLFREQRAEAEKWVATLAPLRDRILTTQKEDAPLVARDGGIFKSGTHPDLDRLLVLNSDGQNWLIQYEAEQREKTGIPSLKVRYNRVFGYYIEVTSANLKSVPAHYQRKQTTVGGERFFTEELAKYEEEILTALVRQKQLEQELFSDLLAAIREQGPALQRVAQLLGEWDALTSLSMLALRPGWHFPEINAGLSLRIDSGRHPVVDSRSNGTFVPNSLTLDPESCRTLIITGPNMGGKSTLMRQCALIVILGQMGAPVPAASASWGLVSSVHTRIGAQDAIATGQSTFMVEMTELARILTDADERSLIILDEIGRGTSTYDGMSVAMSTLEWITQKIHARTLFATHYHELTRLSESLTQVKNAHMAVAKNETTHQIRFLYQLKDGPASESYGIHVARLAGLPKPLITRAWKILAQLESDREPAASAQLSLFGDGAASLVETPAEDPPTQSVHPVLAQLQALNLNELRPIDLFHQLDQWQKVLEVRQSG